MQQITTGAWTLLTKDNYNNNLLAKPYLISSPNRIEVWTNSAVPSNDSSGTDLASNQAVEWSGSTAGIYIRGLDGVIGAVSLVSIDPNLAIGSATGGGGGSGNTSVTIAITGNPSSIYITDSFTITATLSGGSNESGHVISVTPDPVNANILTTTCTLSTASPTGTITITPQVGTPLQNYIFNVVDSKGGTVTPSSFVVQVLPKWLTLGTAGFSAGSAFDVSSAISPSGVSYVAYSDDTSGGKTTVMKFDGTNWINVGTAGFSAGIATYTSLAINSSGIPYVAYRDGGNSNKATVMKFDGTNWVNVGTAGFSAGVATYTSLAINSSGVPYVAYQDQGSGTRATVMKFDGTSWINVGTAGFSGGLAQYLSLAINSSGIPYLAYKDGGSGDKATVMQFNGAAWVNVGVAGFSAGIVSFTSLAINSSGVPYVFYADLTIGSKGTTKKFDGTNWVTVGVAGFSAGAVNYTSIAINSSGVPYVTYRDGTNLTRATVMKFNGANWVNVGNPGFSAGGTSDTTIALNSSGVPYVAYQDQANSNKATVMYFYDVTTSTYITDVISTDNSINTSKINSVVNLSIRNTIKTFSDNYSITLGDNGAILKPAITNSTAFLPLASEVGNGFKITVTSDLYSCTIARNGTDLIRGYDGVQTSNVIIAKDVTAYFISDGSNLWQLTTVVGVDGNNIVPKALLPTATSLSANLILGVIATTSAALSTPFDVPFTITPADPNIVNTNGNLIVQALDGNGNSTIGYKYEVQGAINLSASSTFQVGLFNLTANQYVKNVIQFAGVSNANTSSIVTVIPTSSALVAGAGDVHTGDLLVWRFTKSSGKDFTVTTNSNYLISLFQQPSGTSSGDVITFTQTVANNTWLGVGTVSDPTLPSGTYAINITSAAGGEMQVVFGAGKTTAPSITPVVNIPINNLSNQIASYIVGNNNILYLKCIVGTYTVSSRTPYPLAFTNGGTAFLPTGMGSGTPIALKTKISYINGIANAGYTLMPTVSSGSTITLPLNASGLIIGRFTVGAGSGSQIIAFSVPQPNTDYVVNITKSFGNNSVNVDIILSTSTIQINWFSAPVAGSISYIITLS